MSRRGFYIDENVYCSDPALPGDQLALVLDVAGHWVLLRNDTGANKGKQVWVHHLRVKHYDCSLESPHNQRVQDKREEACRYIHTARPGLAGVCQVCFNPLYPLQHLREDGMGYEKASAWLYCPACDRTQRVREAPA
jgi:hypothetical protein